MLIFSTIEKVKALRLGAMAHALEQQLQDTNAYSELGFEERLGLLVDAEWNHRQANKLDKLIRSARFSLPHATIEDIEYHEDRKLDKATILRFSTCKYIEEGHHIIFKGASGNGKTYLACALGNAACRKYKSVRYIRMPELLDELSVAASCGESAKVLKHYTKVDLLIVDEWLIRTLSSQESYALLEIVEARCQHGAMILCTQYEQQGWYERITPNPDIDGPISEAIMDRIVHRSYEIRIDGKISMRERFGLK